ncbi:MAG: hypothetical protein ACYSUL_12235 [Planctomycetota bacterium]
MLKNRRFWKILLLLVAIVLTNIFFGCVHKHYYGPDKQSQTREQEEIEKQEEEIKALEKEIEELKKQQ